MPPRLIVHHIRRSLQMAAHQRRESFQRPANLTQCSSGVRIVLVSASRHQPRRQMQGHTLMQRQSHVSQIIIAIDAHQITVLPDRQTLTQVLNIPPRRRAVYPHLAGDLGPA